MSWDDMVRSVVVEGSVWGAALASHGRNHMKPVTTRVSFVVANRPPRSDSRCVREARSGLNWRYCAPARRACSNAPGPAWLIDLIWKRQIYLGKVFDLTLPLEQAAEGYKAMGRAPRHQGAAAVDGASLPVVPSS
jgi:hypothetical protein